MLDGQWILRAVNAHRCRDSEPLRAMPTNMIFLAVHLFVSKRKYVFSLLLKPHSDGHTGPVWANSPLRTRVSFLPSHSHHPSTDVRSSLNFRKARAEDESTVDGLEVSHLRFSSRSIHEVGSRRRAGTRGVGLDRKHGLCADSLAIFGALSYNSHAFCELPCARSYASRRAQLDVRRESGPVPVGRRGRVAKDRPWRSRAPERASCAVQSRTRIGYPNRCMRYLVSLIRTLSGLCSVGHTPSKQHCFTCYS